MIKKRILHIYIIAQLVSLLISCSPIIDEEIIRAQDKVGISFTLSMNSAGAISRSLTPDLTDEYENTISQDMFRVLAYEANGMAHEVTIFSMEKISPTVYQISGDLKGSHSIDKVVILANCDKSFNPYTTPLNNLTYNYLASNFNPEKPQSYIPMWGVMKIEDPLVAGTNNEIGTIKLLRAMAKIQVAMSATSTSKLVKAAITQYNTQGACVPSTFESIKETADVTEATIPNGTTTANNLDFYQMTDKSYVLHLPEYKNKDSQDRAIISVTVKDINGNDHQKEIQIGKYTSGTFTSEYWDILRNNYYRFNLTMEVAADGDLTLEVKTEKYAEFELKPEYGDE